jgi:PAS domain S-box-containing protein
MESVASMNLENIFSQSPRGILLFNSDLEVIQVNPSAEKITGYSAETLMGKGFFEHCFPEELFRNRMVEKAQAALTEPWDDLDIAMTNATGDKISIHVAGSNYQDGPHSFIGLIIQDVTNKKAFEKVMENSFDNFIKVTRDLDAAMKTISEQKKILEDYKNKMVRELGIAKSVQKAIIPKTFPFRDNFEVYGVSMPSEELGGDYFDFFQLDDELIGILIADVSGHGVPSSLITTMVKAYFEYYTKRYWEPEKVLYNVNKDMAAIIMDTGFYLTAYYCVLDLNSLRLTVSTAGHDYGLCATQGSTEVLKLGEGAEGTILGIFPEAEYFSETVQLNKNSKVVLYTDGITEARADTGEFYGTDRLEDFMVRNVELGAQDAVENLVQEIDSFYGTSKPNDDRTLVIFNVLGEESAVFDPKETFKNGKRFLLEKNFRRALREFQKIISRDPSHSEAQYLAGQCSSFLTEYSSAERFLSEAIALDGRNYKAYYYLGIVYHNTKQFKKAKDSWEKVIQINGPYKDTQRLLEKLEKKI